MTPIDATEWDAFVRHHPDGTFFHLSAWREVVWNVFRHQPYPLFARKNGELSAVLPLVQVRSRLFGHALISNAFCVGGGPLAKDANSLAEILAQAEALGQKLGAAYVELRDTTTSQPGWISRSDLYAGFEAPIPPKEEDNLKQIPRKQRAVLRKAMDRQLQTTVDSSADDFFQLYSRTMRDHGTPALPKRFFTTLLQSFGRDCEILTVRQAGRPLSSVLSYYFRDRVLPYYTGSHPDARTAGANDLMYWAVMRRAGERGCGVFDFGRSKVGTGPYSFKRNWGFEPRPITHHYRLFKQGPLPNLNPTNPKYAAFIQAWRRLPLPVANGLGPLLSRNLA